jgi:hypothetical protein
MAYGQEVDVNGVNVPKRRGDKGFKKALEDGFFTLDFFFTIFNKSQKTGNSRSLSILQIKCATQR